MNDAIVRNLHRLPPDIDLVVGIPRSGMLAANLFCLITNIAMTDLDSLLEGRIYSSGTSSKRRSALDRGLPDMRRILVLDDSIRSGKAMRAARERLEAAGLGGRVMMGAVFGIQSKHVETDFIFEVVPDPRVFQWNLMHHVILKKSCVDIDGVLCVDPTREENDDGPAYAKFLAEAFRLHAPTQRIGTLVTSRLEKYRGPTEAWLARHEIEYDKLVMLDLPSKAERQRLKAHGSFKAEVYRKSDAHLFIESEFGQAETIARVSGKPVFCVDTQQMISPDALSVAALRQELRNLPSRLRQANSAGSKIKTLARSVLGEAGYLRLKNIVKSGTTK
ncbi:phosphoribosyltransferase [Paracoccus rhizosphaerae]|uniref:Phosphoribosyltransferase n=2 Tax=Paracoccus rhizosphaerae TaxID=1133347 RepID=A0ABV6CJM7_9RHOB|nr:phosphoribosyltransferase [Paracoccus rhizosphaerae]